jgi:hypothetical protein
VHSIGELAERAAAALGMQQGPPGAAPPQGAPGQQQPGPPGWAGQPQAGPAPGWTGSPQAGPAPGWTAEPQAGPLRGRGAGGFRPRSTPATSSSLEDDIASAALGAAARFIGRKVGQRVQRALNEQVLPALAAQQQDRLRTQIEIAQRHPDLRACLTDGVVFLAGGSRVLPLSSVSPTLTVEQADALVASLREG